MSQIAWIMPELFFLWRNREIHLAAILVITSCVSGRGNRIGPVFLCACVCVCLYVNTLTAKPFDLSVCYIFVLVSKSIITKGLCGKRNVHWGNTGGT